MTLNGWLQIALMLALVVATARPLGLYMAAVFEGKQTFLDPVLRPVERGFYGLAGVDEKREQSALSYAAALLMFNLAGFILLYAILRLQHLLPWNPQGFGPMSEHLAFNTAASFVSNTNWQSYGGETTLSYFSQMVGLTTQNFVSAATGIAIVVPLARAFARSKVTTVGNFWVDLTRTTLYVLLPLSIVTALVFVVLGMPQNLSAYIDATTLEGGKQTLAQGPVASQIAIKQLGTNGGGFFNVNSAHPYENPNIWTNTISVWAILCLSLGLAVTFGRMIGKEREGWALLGVMMLFMVVGCSVAYWAEAAGNPLMQAMGVTGGNMEGKEVRFGVAQSATWATFTTGASNGSVNSMHNSYMPLGGLVPLALIQIGEIVPGGVGSGLYGIVVFAILAMFVAGLMVGRTPEYLGKKLEAKDVKMAMLAVLIMPIFILGILCDLGGAAGRTRGPRQPRRTRLYRDPLCLLVSGWQQRLGLRRPHGQCALVRHDDGHHHAGMPLRHHRAGHGDHRLARREAEACGLRRHLPDQWSAVRRSPYRRARDLERSRILPRPRSRTDRRALPDACRQNVLSNSLLGKPQPWFANAINPQRSTRRFFRGPRRMPSASSIRARSSRTPSCSSRRLCRRSSRSFFSGIW